MYTVPRQIVPPPPSAGAWNVGPCERRVDGGRVTEYVMANDWLSGTRKGERDSTLNPLVVSQDSPPKLPMYMSRDHLHDRNREFVGDFDPARPALQTYVRVTRRRAPPEIEAQLARERLERAAIDERMQEMEVAERNELLELRSMGVRTAIEASQEANWRIQTGQWRPGQRQSEDPRSNRADQLHKKLGVDKVQLVTSPLQIDTTPQAEEPAPTPAAATTGAPDTTMRGGVWPVRSDYFTTPQEINKSPHMKTVATGKLKTSVQASG